MTPAQPGKGFLLVHQWPESDRQAWALTALPTGLFDEASAAAGWSPARRLIVQQAYGRWLTWLTYRGLLDPQIPAGERLTPALLAEFVRDLAQRLAPATIVISVCGIKGMMEAIASGFSWDWMRPLYRNLKRAAVPVRDKHTRIVEARALFESGLRLFQEAEDRPLTNSAAVLARNGLTISLLAARPLRIGNFIAIEIGEHLVRNGNLYRIAFGARETKVGRPIDFLCPEHLTPLIDRYLEVYRPLLLANAKDQARTRRFWIDLHGRPLRSSAMRVQINQCTKQIFGHSINPHLFRDCAATSIAVHDPEHVRIATVILGHARVSTTNKHYNQAAMLTASRDFSHELLRLRGKARSWRSRKPSRE